MPTQRQIPIKRTVRVSRGVFNRLSARGKGLNRQSRRLESFLIAFLAPDFEHPESANPVQQSVTVIEIRPFRGGWQCFEGPGVQPYWTGDTAKEDAIGYATARAKFGRGEIRVLNHDGKVQTIIPLTRVQKP
jgi:hypothetical protein